MKLVRFGAPGSERPGIMTKDGKRKDCSSLVPDYDRAFLDGGGLDRLRRELDSSVNDLPDVDKSARWAAPIARPGKIVCVGLNYSDHAKESGMDVPKEPVLFMKAANTLVGPNDDVLIPRGSEKTDWEVELAVIMGKDTKYLSDRDKAGECIAGYAVSNDVSERAFQLVSTGQWTKGKSCDTFNPLGPWLVTPDEIPDVGNLKLTLDVNGQRMQNGSTSTMVYDPFYLVYYISQFMTLEAGDVINTGTPPGVGLGQKPPFYLKEGDVMELEIDGLGKQRQVCGRD